MVNEKNGREVNGADREYERAIASEKGRHSRGGRFRGVAGGDREGEEGETSPLRKLCAHSKDRFKVYGRRIIPFIVLVNPGIYTPRRSSPHPPSFTVHTPPPTFRV